MKPPGIAHGDPGIAWGGISGMGQTGKSNVHDHVQVLAHGGTALPLVAISIFPQSQPFEGFTVHQHGADVGVILSEFLHVKTSIGQILVEVPFPSAGPVVDLCNDLFIPQCHRHHMGSHRPRPLHIRQPADPGIPELGMGGRMTGEVKVDVMMKGRLHPFAFFRG